MDLSSHLKRTTETDKINEAKICKTPFLRQQKMTADRWGKNEVSLTLPQFIILEKFPSQKHREGKFRRQLVGSKLGRWS